MMPFCQILATACFFVVMFKRKISATKWRALVLLVCGTILVSNPDAMTAGKDRAQDEGGSDTDVNSAAMIHAGDKLLG